MTLDTLISRLRRIDAEPTPDELADILWLISLSSAQEDAPDVYNDAEGIVAPEMAEGQGDVVPAKIDRAGVPGEDLPSAEASVPKDAPIQEQDVPPVSVANHETTVVRQNIDVTPVPPPSRGDADTSDGNLSAWVGGTRALSNPAAFVRALRPLKQRVASRKRLILDEDATARRIAEEGLSLPVFVPERSRWLDLAIIVDDAPSMAVWGPMVQEFVVLMRGLGAFDTLRVYRLDASQREHVRLLNETGGSELALKDPVDPLGRRAVLVITDAMAPGWYGEALKTVLRDLGARQPLALALVLPAWLWNRTALSGASALRARAHGRLVRAAGLTYRALSPRFRRAQETWPLPVFSLSASGAEGWSRTLAGIGGAEVGAILIDSLGSLPPAAAESLTAEIRLKEFRARASEPARRLVVLFAAVPLQMGVMRVMAETVPGADLAHLAEVVGGGLMRLIESVGEETWFEFYEGVEDLLLDDADPADSLETFRKASTYLERSNPDSFSLRVLFETTESSDDTRTPRGRFARLGKRLLQLAHSSTEEGILSLKDVDSTSSKSWGEHQSATPEWPSEIEFPEARLQSVDWTSDGLDLIVGGDGMGIYRPGAGVIWFNDGSEPVEVAAGDARRIVGRLGLDIHIEDRATGSYDVARAFPPVKGKSNASLAERVLGAYGVGGEWNDSPFPGGRVRDQGTEGNFYVALSKNRRVVAVGSEDGSLELRETLGSDSRAYFSSLLSGNVAAVALSPDGAWFAAASGRTLAAGSSDMPERSSEFLTHDDLVVSLSFSGDGELLAVLESGGRILIRSVADWYLIQTIEGEAVGDNGSVAFHPSHPWVAVAVGNGRSVRLHKLEPKSFTRLLESPRYVLVVLAEREQEALRLRRDLAELGVRLGAEEREALGAVVLGNPTSNWDSIVPLLEGQTVTLASLGTLHEASLPTSLWGTPGYDVSDLRGVQALATHLLNGQNELDGEREPDVVARVNEVDPAVTSPNVPRSAERPKEFTSGEILFDEAMLSNFERGSLDEKERTMLALSHWLREVRADGRVDVVAGSQAIMFSFEAQGPDLPAARLSARLIKRSFVGRLIARGFSREYLLVTNYMRKDVKDF